MRVVKPWPRLPGEAVDALSLETSEARLDGALSTLIQWKLSLLIAAGLDWMSCMSFKGPFQPKLFSGSIQPFKCFSRVGASTVNHLAHPINALCNTGFIYHIYKFLVIYAGEGLIWFHSQSCHV